MGLGFLTLEDSIDGVLGADTDAWSYCVAIHSCVAIPHCVGIASCSACLCFKVHTHTQKKHMRGQRMSQKIASRASSDFASSNRQGTAVERACAAACVQAKLGYSESANEQSSRAQGGSEPGRRGASRAMTADQAHAAAAVEECANSGQRGRSAHTCGPHGVPQESLRFFFCFTNKCCFG